MSCHQIKWREKQTEIMRAHKGQCIVERESVYKVSGNRNCAKYPILDEVEERLRCSECHVILHFVSCSKQSEGITVWPHILWSYKSFHVFWCQSLEGGQGHQEEVIRNGKGHQEEANGLSTQKRGDNTD